MILRLKNFFRLFFKFLYYFSSFFIFIGDITLFLIEKFLLIILNFLILIKNFLFYLLKKIFSLVYFFKKIILDLRKKIRFSSFISQEKTIKIKYFLIGLLTGLIIFFIYQGYLFVLSLPSPKNIGKINYSLSTHIYDRNNRLLYEIYKDQNRTEVSLKDLPPYLIQATVAIEDKDFFKHNGVDFFGGILRALKENIFHNSFQGGSTITQQLVKTSLLTPERTLIRKIKEIILALWTERLYTKNQILEMYLNQVSYGGSAYGVEEAAKTYFGKSAKDLTLAEAAFLAGLPQAPSIYSPYLNPQAAIKRKNEVLEAMEKQGYIDKETKTKAQQEKLEILPPRTNIQAPHFVFYVKSQLESIYGVKKVEEGGLKVITTLDLDIQKEAEKILKEEIEKNRYLNINNGAILITKPSTGEILAMVGSVDYFEKPWGAYNVTTALRQPGSSIKPIMYSLALQEGYTAATIIDDSPVVFNIPGSQPYRPVNYDGRFHGKIPLRYALANSYNIPAVKVLNVLGVEKFIDYARKLGINSWVDKSRYGLSLTLGGGEVRMIEMAEAFGVLANLGYRAPLNYYLEIKDSVDNTIKKNNFFKEKKIDSGVAYIISDILSDNNARTWAFGRGSALEIPGYKVAVKTGTTDDKRDNWTIGYTPNFLVAVWVGNNDNSPMNPYLTSGITGAAPIWNRVMSFLLKKYQQGASWYKKPENIVEKRCYFGKVEYFLKGTENSINCSSSIFITPSPTSNQF